MSKIYYVDIGARGDLTAPWSEHRSDLYVYGFEPDPIENQRLNSVHPNRHYYPVGLFSKSANLLLYITEQPSQSSIYPPSDNSMFEDRHWYSRRVVEELVISSATLDEKLNGLPVDAIKIDTQGAEYAILEGGRALISSQNPFLFLETWVHPVYSGAPLMQDILQLLYPLGYELWAVETAASWRYKIENADFRMDGARQRLIGLNLMLLPSFDNLKLIAAERIQARIKILRWYGFLDAAYLLAEHIGNRDLMDSIGNDIIRRSSFAFRLVKKIKKVLFKTRDFPPIT